MQGRVGSLGSHQLGSPPLLCPSLHGALAGAALRGCLVPGDAERRQLRRHGVLILGVANEVGGDRHLLGHLLLLLDRVVESVRLGLLVEGEHLLLLGVLLGRGLAPSDGGISLSIGAIHDHDSVGVGVGIGIGVRISIRTSIRTSIHISIRICIRTSIRIRTSIHISIRIRIRTSIRTSVGVQGVLGHL